MGTTTCHNLPKTYAGNALVRVGIGKTNPRRRLSAELDYAVLVIIPLFFDFLSLKNDRLLKRLHTKSNRICLVDI